MAVRTALLALLALAGCSSADDTGTSKIFKAAVERVRGGGEAATAATGQAPARMTREQVEATGVAVVRARSVDQAGRSTFLAQVENGGYVTYISRFGQMLTLNGSLITGARGMGTDLLSVTPDPRDPTLTPTPLDAWPTAISRTYRTPGRGPGGRAISVTCTYERGDALEVEILEVQHKGRQMTETCTDGADVSFENNHVVGLETGRVWRSIQWLGPDQGFVDLEVIEPFTPE